MYAWQQPYLEAVKETDNTKMPHHLLEATAAVEQRLLSPIDKHSDEFLAIRNTQSAIKAMKKMLRYAK